MPIYEYRCSACSHQQEFLQKLSDAPLTRCTSCGEDTFQKMVTAAGFQLKGSGWYATDFKSKPAKSADAAKPADGEKPADAAKPGEAAGPAQPAQSRDATASNDSAKSGDTKGGAGATTPAAS